MSRILVSVAIVTRNRRRDVVAAVESALAQRLPEKEVLVFDGGSTDGTAEIVRRSFPEVRLWREERDPGFVAARNRLVREAQGEYVVGLDDDAYFTAPDTLERVQEGFGRYPAAAVLALPFMVPGRGRLRPGEVPLQPGQELANYTGCAWAIRRGVALEMGPFRELEEYLKEDRDLSLRLLARGYEIRLADCAPVVHRHSPVRDWEGRLRLDVISTLLLDWFHVPGPYLPGRLVKDAVSLLFYRARGRDLPRRVRYIAEGLARCRRYRCLRRPVPVPVWRRYRRLPSHGPLPGGEAVPSPLRRTVGGGEADADDV